MENNGGTPHKPDQCVRACICDLTRHRLWGTCNNRTMDPTREFFRKGTMEKTIRYPISPVSGACAVEIANYIYSSLLCKGQILGGGGGASAIGEM